MKQISPTTITDEMLVSINVDEPAPGELVYSAGETYAKGARRIVLSTHRVYESLQDGNVGNNPTAEPAASPVWWKNVGPTRKYAAFDGQASTQSLATDTWTLVIEPGIVEGIGLDGLVGNAVQIQMTAGPTGPEVFNREWSLEGSPITDWFEYFNAPFVQISRVVATDLPAMSEGRITITVTGVGQVGLGSVIVGPVTDIGLTLAEVEIGDLDYSKKKVDAETGDVTLEPGRSRDTVRCMVHTEIADVAKVMALLKKSRGLVCVWILETDDALNDALILFGFRRSFKLALKFTSLAYFTLEIEGMSNAAY